MPHLPAPAPVHGTFADGYQDVAACFAHQVATGEEIGAALTVYRHGERVVHLWGGRTDQETGRTWQEDTRVVLFSVTKAFAAAAFHLLADRGELDWDAPVGTYWPGFAVRGKEDITVRMLANHQGGLAALDRKITLEDCCREDRQDKVRKALESQRPLWEPGRDQGYHATTYGLYLSELFRQIKNEDIGAFLQRELFAPLGSDVCLGTPAAYDALAATLYPPPAGWRIRQMAVNAVAHPDSAESRILRDVPRRGSLCRRAFTTPTVGSEGIAAYDTLPVRRASLAWASATGSADGVARALLPFAHDGTFNGRRYFSAESLQPIMRRQGWSQRDRVLQKPLGWSQGFLKEERHVFCPNPTSFGHSGMGGALAWCDPATGVSLGYVMNRMDWRVRSPRIVALCRALFNAECMLEADAQPQRATQR